MTVPELRDAPFRTTKILKKQVYFPDRIPKALLSFLISAFAISPSNLYEYTSFDDLKKEEERPYKEKSRLSYYSIY